MLIKEVLKKQTGVKMKGRSKRRDEIKSGFFNDRVGRRDELNSELSTSMTHFLFYVMMSSMRVTNRGEKV